MAIRRPVVAILLGAPFNYQNYERVGIPYLDTAFDVVVIDCNSWLRIGYADVNFTKHPYSNVIDIANPQEFEDAVERINADYAIDFIGFHPWEKFVQQTLQNLGTIYVIQRTGLLPRGSLSKRAKRRIRQVVGNPFAFLKERISRIIREHKTLHPDVALLSGRKSLDGYTKKSKNLIWIGSNDYYTYRKVQNRLDRGEIVSPVEPEYILFIDDCIALASDYTLLGISAPVDPDEYLEMLGQSFDKVEQILGLPVVVAAHPNGKDIPEYRTVFGSRKVYFDITPELCSQSTLVMAHCSTALSYVGLWNKPLVILTSEAMDNSHMGMHIHESSSQFRCPLIFMESEIELYRSAIKISQEIDVLAYRSYIDNYIITPRCTEQGPWEGFIEFVNSDYARSR